MNDTREVGCLETFKSVRREHLAGGKTVQYFEYTFKDGIDCELAQQTAIGLSIAYILGRTT